MANAPFLKGSRIWDTHMDVSRPMRRGDPMTGTMPYERGGTP